MNTRKLLVSVLMLVCVLLSACAPATTPVPATSVPAVTQALDEFALVGDPIPDDLLNTDYLLGSLALHLRPADDPICQQLKTQGNCFTILVTDKPSDPGARGPAALVDGLIAVKIQRCPYCVSSEIGSIEYFEVKDDGTLVGVKCETKTGGECSADVGTTWKPAPQQTTFHSPENTSFRLPLAFTYGPEWDVHIGVNTLDIVKDNSWGAGIALVNGALVHDPASVVSKQSASADKADFVPWPDDFFAYLASIPDVKVIQGPEPVTIGGIKGSQIILHTPAMHPFLWLAGDYNWLGGGASGVDPEFKRLLILLEVNGERVLLEFDDIPEKFDERYPLVMEIFNSITFGK